MVSILTHSIGRLLYSVSRQAATCTTFVLMGLLSLVTAAEPNLERFTLTDGRVLTGTYDERTQQLAASFGTMKASLMVTPEQIARRETIQATPPIETVQPPAQAAEPSQIVFPGAERAVEILAGLGMGTFHQVPAIVIEDGPLRLVPYLSYQIDQTGHDFFGGVVELNIYGDPASPCAIELGITRDPQPVAGASTEAKSRQAMAAFLISLLNRPWTNKTPPGIVRAISRKITDESTENGIAVNVSDVLLDITLPTAADAYGGWWIGLSRPALCEQQRCSRTEMEVLSVACRPTQVAVQQVEKTPDKPKPVAAVVIPTDSGWTSLTDGAPTYTSPRIRESNSSRLVYVKAYTRKDGTYVSAHSRRR